MNNYGGHLLFASAFFFWSSKGCIIGTYQSRRNLPQKQIYYTYSLISKSAHLTENNNDDIIKNKKYGYQPIILQCVSKKEKKYD